MELKTPYKDLLPPLSTEEFESLRQSIEMRGVENPVVIDEDGNILDGHHRYAICPDAPTRVIAGLSEGEKQAEVLRRGSERRNMSPDQKKEHRKRQQKIAKALREEGRTQEQVARLLGVTQQAVALWFKDGNNTSACNASVPDSRVKIPAKERPVVVQAVADKPVEQVAADYGVTSRRVRQIVTKEKKEVEAKQKREEAAMQRKGDNGIVCADFRQVEIADESIDMILADPPYNKEAADLYWDIAELAMRALVKGGWLLVYSGQAHLPEVMMTMSTTNGLEYAWTFAILHSGGDLRFRKYKLHNHWKPVVAAYKPPLDVHWDWFKDTVSGGKEKTEHPWQQAAKEAEHFIGALCPEGGIVLDPCCGSGTSLVAAKAMGRQWVGYEIDEDTAEKARQRIGDE